MSTSSVTMVMTTASRMELVMLKYQLPIGVTM